MRITKTHYYFWNTIYSQWYMSKQKDYLLYKSSFFNDIVRVKENYRNILNKKKENYYEGAKT